MKTATKILLITGLCLILIGAALFVGVMARNDWDFASLGGTEYETRTYPVTEDFRSIDLRTETENIVFLPAGDGACRVEITEKKEQPHKVAVKDGTLCIEQPEDGDWSITLFSLSFADPKITVYLPKGEYERLFIEESTGDIAIPGDFRFAQIDVTASTGDIDCRASATGELRIEASTGSIRLADLSAGSLNLTVSTGRVEVSDVTCTGDGKIKVSTGKTLLTNLSCGSFASQGSTGDLTMKNVTTAGTITVKRSTGDVRFEGCDAAELEIETDTGDVKGTLLTEKVFIVRSDTGRIRVPESVTGGKCKVTTDTGDIEIRIN